MRARVVLATMFALAALFAGGCGSGYGGGDSPKQKGTTTTGGGGY